MCVSLSVYLRDNEWDENKNENREGKKVRVNLLPGTWVYVVNLFANLFNAHLNVAS